MSYSAGIGEKVNSKVIYLLNKHIAYCGINQFYNAIYNGEYNHVAYAYIHPCDDMRTTKNFDIIQKAFINAYV